MDLSDWSPWLNQKPIDDIPEVGFDEDIVIERLRHDVYTEILKDWLDGKIVLTGTDRRAIMWYLKK